MFTHQDAAVWADLTMILWAAGLRVTAAWCIATETDSASNRATMCRAPCSWSAASGQAASRSFSTRSTTAWKSKVRRQLDEMLRPGRRQRPELCRAPTTSLPPTPPRCGSHEPTAIEEINPEREITRVRPKGEAGPVEQLIRNAVKIACDHLVPKGLDREEIAEDALADGALSISRAWRWKRTASTAAV